MKESFLFLAFVATLQLLNALPGDKNDTKIKILHTEILPVKGPEAKALLGTKPTDKNTVEKQKKELEPHQEANYSGEKEEDEDEDEDEEQDKKDFLESKTRDEEGEEYEEEEGEDEAELNPDLFEGDLKLSKEEINYLKEQTMSKKDSVTEVARRWPDARVPYSVDRRFAEDKQRMRLLETAIEKFKKLTCVRFVPKRWFERSHIKFIIGRGCYSTSVGKRKRGGRQTISIGRGCTRIGTVLHEMMHAIGFFHEHTRRDRDEYITIKWENIENDKQSQFMMYNHGEADYLNEPYDYKSVMHYSRTAFGKETKGGRMVTIIPKKKPWADIGQRKKFSDIDLRQINKLYKCKKFTSTY